MTKWMNKRTIAGLIIAVIGLVLILNSAISNIIKVVQNDGLNYRKAAGPVVEVRENEVVVEYGVDGTGHYAVLNYQRANDELVGYFLKFYHHKDDPHLTTFTNYKELLVFAIIDIVVSIVGLAIIIYILVKRHTLAHDSHRVVVNLIGIDKKALVYADNTDDSAPKRVYYTKSYYFENDYKELVENGKTTGTLIVANKNSKWWSFDYSEIKEALK